MFSSVYRDIKNVILLILELSHLCVFINNRIFIQYLELLHTALLFCFVAMFVVFNPGLSFIQKLKDKFVFCDWNRFSSIRCMVPTIIVIIWKIKGMF